MVDFEQGLHNELSAIVRTYPMSAPEGTSVPFLIYAKSSGEMIKTLDGISRTRDVVYELALMSNTYAELQVLFDNVKTKIASMPGRFIGVDSVFVQSAIIEDMIESYEDDVRWYRMDLNVRFYYKEV